MSTKYIVSAIVTITFFSYTLQSQVKGLTGFDTEKLMQEEAAAKLNMQQISRTELSPVGNVVIAEKYIIGPGDILSIQNLTASINQEFFIISTECTAMLPRIGEIFLKDKTLAEVRKLINDAYIKRNPNSIVSVSLHQPRTVVISISGNVINPGTYSFPASYRISTALKVANMASSQNLAQQTNAMSQLKVREINRDREREFMKTGTPLKPKFSSRNIIVLHNDGSSTINDLEKAFVYNDPSLDNYLREGDEIIVQYEDVNSPVISISGAVLRPCIVAWKKGDRISTLLKFGYGLSDNADPEKIFIIYPDGKKQQLKVDGSMNLVDGDAEIEHGSSITVSQLKFDKNTPGGTVTITGKVKNPGIFVITNRVTRLKDVIEMSGGFTDEAYLPLAYILRRENRYISNINPYKDISETFQYSDLTLEDTTRFNLDINYRKPIVSCDFADLFRNNSAKDNIFLEDGDVIVIPPNPKSVFVFGQVNLPGYIAFEENRNFEWYIEKAGGYATRSEKSRARIIRGKNKVWLKPESETPVYAGDEIYVPRPPDMPPGVEIQTYSLIATAVTTAISLTYLILTLFSK